MRGKWLLLGGVVILLAVAAGALSWYWRGQPESNANPAAALTPPQSAASSDVTLVGKIQARHLIPVPAPIDGTLEAFEVIDGQEVYEGQLLARIKNTSLESAKEGATLEADKAQLRVNNLEASLIAARLEASRARADATRARSEMERAEKVFLRQQMLFREGATPRLTFEKSQKDFAGAQSESGTLNEAAGAAEERVLALGKTLDDARRTLTEKSDELENVNTELLTGDVHSPVDGVLIAHKGEAGSEVSRGLADLFQIAVNLTELEAVVEPEPPALARIKPGLAAAVQVAEAGDEPLAGKVRELRGSQVIVDFSSPLPAVKPGLTAHVTIKTAEAPAAVK